MCIIAAPGGVKALTEAHPDIRSIALHVDDHLNEIVTLFPGLGDAGAAFLEHFKKLSYGFCIRYTGINDKTSAGKTFGPYR